MFNDPIPQPPEYLHTKVCLGSAIISAVQNLRDDPGYSEVTFVQANFTAEALSYLHTGIQFCTPDCVAQAMNEKFASEIDDDDDIEWEHMMGRYADEEDADYI